MFRSDFELIASHAAGKSVILPKMARLSVTTDEIQRLEAQRDGSAQIDLADDEVSIVSEHRPSIGGTVASRPASVSADLPNVTNIKELGEPA